MAVDEAQPKVHECQPDCDAALVAHDMRDACGLGVAAHVLHQGLPSRQHQHMQADFTHIIDAYQAMKRELLHQELREVREGVVELALCVQLVPTVSDAVSTGCSRATKSGEGVRGLLCPDGDHRRFLG
jgi:hypothetical protein